MKFRKRATVVEAIQWTGSDQSHEDIARMGTPIFDFWRGKEKLGIRTIFGTDYVSKGDWVVKEGERDFRVIRATEFAKTFEIAEPEVGL